MSESIKLSQMPCYAGLWKAEVIAQEPFIPTQGKESIEMYEKPGVTLQFVEGCGYTVFNLTPEEADELVKQLQYAAMLTRLKFGPCGEGNKGLWNFERSSGYAGFRCSQCGTWVYHNEKKVCKCKE